MGICSYVHRVPVNSNRKKFPDIVAFRLKLLESYARMYLVIIHIPAGLCLVAV